MVAPSKEPGWPGGSGGARDRRSGVRLPARPRSFFGGRSAQYGVIFFSVQTPGVTNFFSAVGASETGKFFFGIFQYFPTTTH